MKSAIDQARYLMRCRNFAAAIQVLNEKRQVYEESFDYNYTLGLAFLYAGDTGSAAQSFEAARKIKINDANLLLAQAAIHLRRGNTDRAVQYYLDILDLEPQNQDAKRALEFVREHPLEFWPSIFGQEIFQKASAPTCLRLSFPLTTAPTRAE